MKIRKATVTLQDIFNGLEINFFYNEETTIHYLVGNNGSGKTKLLEALYQTITSDFDRRSGNVNFILTIKDYELPRQGIRNDQDYSLVSSWRGGNLYPGTIDNLNISQENLKSLRKGVYSSVEINFNHSEIKNISAEIPDNINPVEKSKDLNKIIPQLLVNLRQQDANIHSNWIKQNAGKNIIIPLRLEGEKLYRFIEAYNEVFDGEKQFKEIKEANGEYKIYFIDNLEKIVELQDLSSGEKQIIYRLGFILKNLDTIRNGFIFIDEPEISLHPKWQLKFKKLLLKIFKNSKSQIFIATHSPYIFGFMDSNKEECIKIDRINNTAQKIQFPSSTSPNSPSMNLVNFLAYGISSREIHIELYNEMQIKSGKTAISDIDIWLASQGLPRGNRSISGGNFFIKNNGTASTFSASETKPTWIRNKIHHSDLSDRKDFTDSDLEESIREMLSLL